MNIKETFNNWIRVSKTRISRPEKYSNTISTISNHFKKSLNKDIDLYQIIDSSELLDIKNEYFSFDEFYKKNITGNSMYSRSLDLYLEFLESNRGKLNSVGNDVLQVENDVNLSTQEKEAIILSRIGQGKFREDLINIWNGCCLTGYSDVRLLVASHIKPWRTSSNTEKIDKYNGLLLLPTFDKLFDLGFISFSEGGKILVSPRLSSKEKLGVNNNAFIKLKEKNISYLEYHRDVIFKS
jgi:predicted restriction endonuclease